LIPKFAWIHYFGSYDFDKKQGIHGNIIAPEKCFMTTANVLDCQDIGAKLDLNVGVVTAGNQSIPIRKLVVKDPKGMIEKKFFENGVIVEIVKFKENHAALFILNPMLAETLFNKMYLLRSYDPAYFELVLDDFPHMVVYKVKEKIQ
jgi:dolichyl-diphosphooligosaccharide--protein glycosyltransferase